MARAVWKGPFVEESLIKKVDRQKNDPNKKPIKTDRKSTRLNSSHALISYAVFCLKKKKKNKKKKNKIQKKKQNQ